jgi:L,D-transpeptidase ErfK/SrfK
LTSEPKETIYFPKEFEENTMANSPSTMISRIKLKTPALFWTLLIFLGEMIFLPAMSAAYQPSWPIFSEVQGGEHWYTVNKKDSLYAIAGRYGSTWEYLASRNLLNPPYKLTIGQRLVASNRHIIPHTQVTDGLLLNIPGHMIYLFEQGTLVKRYPVGLGRPDWPTPEGVFSITGKTKNPTWTVPKSIQEEMKQEGKIVTEKVPPGPDNPLGKYWLPLSIPGYGIHATIWPESIGHSTSHGCIRMITEDVEDLYSRIKTGVPLTIVYEPLKMASTSDKKIFLEVHANNYQKSFSYWKHVQKLAQESGLSRQIDWSKVTRVLNERTGLAEEISQK